MKIQLDGKKWLIKRAPSIYISRNGLEDTCIMAESGAHGAKMDDGTRYETIMRLTAESGEVLRQYGPTHKKITMEFLKDNGFVDHLPERV